MKTITMAAFAAALLLGLGGAAKATQPGIEGGAIAGAGAISGAFSSVYAGPGGTVAAPNAAEARISGGTGISVTVSGSGVALNTGHSLTLTAITQGPANVSAAAAGFSGSGEFAGFAVEGFLPF